MNNVLGVISANYTNESFGSISSQGNLATLPFGGRYRLLDFPLSCMTNSNIKDVALITPFYYRSVVDHVGVGKPWALDRKSGGLFFLPGSPYGAKKHDGKFLMRDIVVNKRFFEQSSAEYVLFCGSNIIFNTDFNGLIKEHIKSGNRITLCYKKVEDGDLEEGLFLDVAKDGSIAGIEHEWAGPANYFIDAGIINRKLLLDVIEWFGTLEYMDFMDILRDNLEHIGVGGYEYKNYIASICNISDYVDASRALFDKDVRKDLFNVNRQIYTKVRDEVPAYVSTNATVKNSMIGAGCIIDGHVENSIIFRSCVVEPGAVIKNCVIMRKCVIEKNANLQDVIMGKYAKVLDGHGIQGTKEFPFLVAKYQNI